MKRQKVNDILGKPSQFNNKQSIYHASFMQQRENYEVEISYKLTQLSHIKPNSF